MANPNQLTRSTVVAATNPCGPATHLTGPMAWLTVWPVMIGLIVCQFAGQMPLMADSPPANPQTIGRLLEQLDSSRFRDRQSAASALAKLGESTLKPMAVYSFDASPESAWRIRSVIEQIGTEGDEATFYKSTGVLRLLFPVDDQSTQQRVAELRQKWQATRKQRAIEALEKLGAVITDPISGNQAMANAQQRWLINNGGRVIVNGQQVTTSSTLTKKRASVTQHRERRSNEQIIKEIDDLLAADVDANRERILGDPAAVENTAANTPQPLNQVNQIRFNVINGRQLNAFRFGVTVQLSDQFIGTANDLRKLQMIPSVSEVQWKNRKLDTKELATVSNVSTIRRVSFEDCEFPKRPLPESAWPRLATHVVFSAQNVDATTLQPLTQSLTTSLTFSKCQIDPNVLPSLAKIDSLNELVLEDFQLDQAWFKTFAKLPSLNRISLSTCKFATDDYQSLRAKRPNVRIEFTPQAFLGIRSNEQLDPDFRRARAIAQMRIAAQAKAAQQKQPGRANPAAPVPANVPEPVSQGCRISEVVADSGAEAGGMLAGDVVRSINRQPIAVFEDIRLIVAQHRAGETLDVQVTRDGQVKELKIKLSKFPDRVVR